MDIVVSLARSFGLKTWIAEGDPAGTSWSGTEWGWFMGCNAPKKCSPGDRVYVVYGMRLIGYAPLVRIEKNEGERGCVLVRRGDAVAVTMDERVKGFRGFRYRWWDREVERPFSEWMG